MMMARTLEFKSDFTTLGLGISHVSFGSAMNTQKSTMDLGPMIGRRCRLAGVTWGFAFFAIISPNDDPRHDHPLCIQ